ncbi:MAG: energy-coupling factor transport system ATP-binding protein [Actinomycetota bacterium]|jgi:energy-coupling factor transport system ATP-binding protein
MIRFESVSFTHVGADAPVLRDLTFAIAEGELCVVIGRTGVGKSTLLGAINGLVPHFTGGHMAGDVVVNGRVTRDCKPRDLADIVGYVGQDPLAAFVTDTVEEELAYAMEQLGVAPAVMRKRVEETLDLLGIAELRSRALPTLSAGQQQRVAIGAALTAQPRVLLLDEPTSALDPTASEDVLASISRLVHDLGITVVMAEHRLERVVHHADVVLSLPGDGSAVLGSPREVFAASPLAPPVVALGQLCGWSPLPLSVRDARRLADPLRAQLSATPRNALLASFREEDRRETTQETCLSATAVVVEYPGVIAVRGVDVELRTGEVVALMGRNGSGKSSLLWALQGSGPRAAGAVDVEGRDPTTLPAGEARRLVGLVPQSPGDLLYLTSVAAELHQADRDADAEPGTTAALVNQLVGLLPPDAHPRDLSEGQRLALVLAIQLAAAPKVMLLDEPTRGLDPSAKDRFATVVRGLAAEGRAVVIATHDVEFVAEVADRVIVMAEGEIVADGPTAEVVCSSTAFAPQVAKILYPAEWLTVAEVAEALDVLP